MAAPKQGFFVSVAEAMNPTRRPHMEDCFVVHQPGEWDSPDDSLFVGLYDGHGGRDMVNFLEHGLSYHVAEELSVDDGSSMKTRVVRAFLMADIHARQAGILSSGATVALCLAKRDPSNQQVILTVANAGDARIVLGSFDDDDGALRLTSDHNVHDPQEVERIEAAGGFCYRNRVLGVLAITRSLGDQVLKNFVLGYPYVDQGCAEAGNSFVVVACDGLWDVLDDQDAVDFVRNWNKDRQGVAQGLVDLALQRGTTDNVTAIVIYL